uniref:Uncharacterized protein n=1 Tax=Rhizophora mucronata TaxID=61149 RepID=A0A2P2NVY9_RHIMU
MSRKGQPKSLLQQAYCNFNIITEKQQAI